MELDINDIIADLDKEEVPAQGGVVARQKSCAVKDLDPSLLNGAQSSAPAYRVSVKSMLGIDQKDQSLQKYKRALLGQIGELSEDKSTQVQFTKCEILAEGNPHGPIRIEVGKKTHIKLKEACVYHMRLQFIVRYDLAINLKLINNVYKGFIKISTSEEMIGSYPPVKHPHVFNLPLEQAPSGLLGRGSYSGKVVVLDSEGTVHLQYEYELQIGKDW